MSNVAREVLDESDQLVILDLLSRNPGKQSILAMAAGLDPRAFGRLLMNRRMSRPNALRFQQLATDIRRDETGTLRRAGIVEPWLGVDANVILATARKMTQERFFAGALFALLQGFEQIRRSRSVEAALFLLPEILY